MPWATMLDDVFGTRAKVRILRSLWRSEGALSGREVARRAGLSHTGALASLDELTSVGVVRRWPQADRSIRFALNEDHALVPAIRAALEGEAGMSLRLVEFLTVHAGEAVSIVVFGSIARGDDTIESDVDVLVVVPDGVDADELNEVFAGLDSASRFGKHVQAHVWTLSTLAAHERARLPLLQRIWSDGRVLGGDDLDLLSWRARRVTDGTRRRGGRKGLRGEGGRVPPRRRSRARA